MYSEANNGTLNLAAEPPRSLKKYFSNHILQVNKKDTLGNVVLDTAKNVGMVIIGMSIIKQ